MRQIVLDTETTGLEPAEGHRVIEIGCIELMNRRITGRRFHQYLQPDREIDAGALAIHGISAEFLADKPRFADIAGELLEFVTGAELIIHNAPFDLGFLQHELTLAGTPVQRLEEVCDVLDTLLLARRMHPGSRNSLDALCRRYQVDASGRTLHGAALDAELLAEVYLAMTGGQVALGLEAGEAESEQETVVLPTRRGAAPLRVVDPTAGELAAHAAMVELLEKSSGGQCLWRRYGG
jgi:DNA polymerase III subunit epsilon